MWNVPSSTQLLAILPAVEWFISQDYFHGENMCVELKPYLPLYRKTNTTNQLLDCHTDNPENPVRGTIDLTISASRSVCDSICSCFAPLCVVKMQTPTLWPICELNVNPSMKTRSWQWLMACKGFEIKAPNHILAIQLVKYFVWALIPNLQIALHRP